MKNRGRIQAQGGRTEKSDAWAIDTDHYKDRGIASVNHVEGQLDNAERLERLDALRKCRDLIENSPSCGISAPMKKTFLGNRRQRSDIRIDIEINAGVAFIDNPHAIIILPNI